MKKGVRFFRFWLIILTGICLALPGCSKKDAPVAVTGMTVEVANLSLQNDLYYLLDPADRSIALIFSEPVDTSTLDGNILMTEKSLMADSACSVKAFGNMVLFSLNPGTVFKPGWQYVISITTGLRSESGLALPATVNLEFRTRLEGLLGSGNSNRNSILCISDIHMGDARAFSGGYCWFSENAAALDSLLQEVLYRSRVKQLVILGDLFDEWIVPYSINPFDPQSGISDSREYFLAVAAAPVNAGIIGSLRAIAGSGVVELIYIPGNHDMLLTREILTEIIPGITWMGDSTGLGHYVPLPEMIMEHGHRYDFFNCPQPVTSPGHILPPGYFISRLDAEGLMKQGTSFFKDTPSVEGNTEFLAAWTAALAYLMIHYNIPLDPDSANIRMGGTDGYQNPLSYTALTAQYGANIQDVWPATAAKNGMPVFMPSTVAIVNSATDLYYAASFEYMESAVPSRYKIVTFGHTHNAMIRVWPAGKNYTGIYANSGTWVNASLTKKPVRTFIEIIPAQWSGSELDLVTLYQYNPDPVHPASGYIPVLLAQESLLAK